MKRRLYCSGISFIFLMVGVILSYFIFNYLHICRYDPSLTSIAVERLDLDTEKMLWNMEKETMCSVNNVYVKGNDQIKIITYECTNNKDVDGVCRYCCIDEPNKSWINEVCFDCKIYSRAQNDVENCIDNFFKMASGHTVYHSFDPYPGSVEKFCNSLYTPTSF